MLPPRFPPTFGNTKVKLFFSPNRNIMFCRVLLAHCQRKYSINDEKCLELSSLCESWDRRSCEPPHNSNQLLLFQWRRRTKLAPLHLDQHQYPPRDCPGTFHDKCITIALDEDTFAYCLRMSTKQLNIHICHFPQRFRDSACTLEVCNMEPVGSTVLTSGFLWWF